jgi:hypothetical protein
MIVPVPILPRLILLYGFLPQEGIVVVLRITEFRLFVQR